MRQSLVSSPIGVSRLPVRSPLLGLRASLRPVASLRPSLASSSGAASAPLTATLPALRAAGRSQVSCSAAAVSTAEYYPPKEASKCPPLPPLSFNSCFAVFVIPQSQLSSSLHQHRNRHLSHSISIVPSLLIPLSLSLALVQPRHQAYVRQGPRHHLLHMDIHSVHSSIHHHGGDGTPGHAA